MPKIEVNPDHFVFFSLRPEFVNRASNSFVLNYYDYESGRPVDIKDNRGNTKRYKFSRSHRMIRIPKSNTVEIDAIKNHPQCEDSPNGVYQNIEGSEVQLNALFREVNSDKDAGVVIDAAMLRSGALHSAVELLKDETKSEEVALVLGISASGKASYASILTYAERNPQDFLDTVNSPDIEARGLVAKAIKNRVLVKKGISLFLGDIEFGVDSTEAVKAVKSDHEKFRVLYRKVYGVDLSEKKEGESKKSK